MNALCSAAGTGRPTWADGGITTVDNGAFCSVDSITIGPTSSRRLPGDDELRGEGGPRPTTNAPRISRTPLLLLNGAGDTMIEWI